MSRRHRPVEKKRGRHKKCRSPETLYWEKEQLIVQIVNHLQVRRRS